jgi:hypothetical protein
MLGFVPQPNLQGLRFLGKTYAVLRFIASLVLTEQYYLYDKRSEPHPAFDLRQSLPSPCGRGVRGLLEEVYC